jgi:hypothetical protein
MVKSMNIADYDAFFHDGSIINIQHTGNEIELSMESAEISENNLENGIYLSKYNTLKGKLHLEGVESILENDQPFTGVLKMQFDSAIILDLEIVKNKVNIFLEWTNYPPHATVVAYSSYEIAVKKIWWENIPNLYDPFA